MSAPAAVAAVKPPVTLLLVKRTVAFAYGLRVVDLEGRRLDRRAVLARHVVYWLGRQLTRGSLPEIGRSLGDRDHTTIIQGLRSLTRKMAEDHALERRVAALERAVLTAAERADAAPVDPVALAYEIVADPAGRAPLSIAEGAALAAALIERIDTPTQGERA